MKNIKLLIAFFCIFLMFKTKAQERLIKVDSKRNDDKSISFTFDKYVYGTYYLSLWFPTLENARSNGYNREVTGPGGNLMRLKPTDDNSHINYSYKYWYIRGKLQPKFNPEFVYFIPISSSQPASVNTMTNLGSEYFQSAKPKNWTSYLFLMHPGDTIFTARKGIVVEISNKNNYITNQTVSYQSTVNKIIIEHPDGTLASYAGFEKDKIWVEEGQMVYSGIPLGKVAQYDNRDQGQLRFSIYYLDFVNPGDKSPTKMKDKVQYYAFITPKFLTENGVQKLETGKSYKAVIDKSLVDLEFTRRERKNFIKNN